jgi:hypothetical protein
MNEFRECCCISNEEAHKILKEMEYEANIDKWISVKDRLPDEDGEYLISMYHRFMIGGIYKKYTGRFVAKYYAEYKEWRIMNDVCTSVTHWMPMPKPPKEDNAK